MRILVGISGGIAAYKAITLVRRLRDAGVDVRVVLTEAAAQFVTPLSLQAVSGAPVRSSLFDAEAEAGMDHIALARWADQIIVAPASADVLARMANGMANDLLTTLILATEAPVTVAPAMNRHMWAHPAVQANLATLKARGVRVIGPASGVQACGEVGAGRMEEPEIIASALLAPPTAVRWQGRHVVITAGGTQEPIDPVRFIANRSSGKMGFALAAAAQATGAAVTLICGPNALATPAGVTRVDVHTALEMHAAVLGQDKMDVFIGAAAVADYRVAQPAPQKIKKTRDTDTLTLTLVKNPDIIHAVAQRSPKPFVVGFAAETEQLLQHARQKRITKGIDLICANRVDDNLAFDQPDNAVTAIWANGERAFARAEKAALATQLIELIDKVIEQD
ncbi:MAG: bifunctional 4'-phosphopantothenoylcysteine decarboxylase/phosphopantothenoylcysteine synthetase [Halothiobacillus sp. 35-54-62]|jgi:phosphopantothenoylcysteine decarboxylase/phosphopantothenate--cysteine ligase|nr:MAG: bifunctional 4'-phosphopantothenoylcysteine decarboxylase/phosphopantothenoylcysteine synthetase [Halothiobacillus sp. 35-54-62]OZA79340.1 MAG: bifunctional 4'-phosphopantothenoylcysteine decarboxylase/phosphopantothenoylcysteine synthetase [Halothiobacillus sp. 39-53-45]HQS03732.1 bifunctional phosphopantothenoylcysteine decarboxylase/phosphopantothenate--cysteine ligase CoaBC [Halothiobacillus sp.]HQS29999.1 bifunctional phosphopantothenoylcysteine decarboxylase/phosphopantothenate--cy